MRGQRWRREQAMVRAERFKRRSTAPGSDRALQLGDEPWTSPTARRCASVGPGPSCGGSRACRFNRFRVRHRPAYFRRRLVLSQTFIHDLAQQVVLRPGQVFDFGDQFGPHPSGRGSKREANRSGCRAAAAYRAASLAWPAAGGGAIDVPVLHNQSQCQRGRHRPTGHPDRSSRAAAPRGTAGSLRDRSSRPRGKGKPQQFCGFHEPGRCQADSKMD